MDEILGTRIKELISRQPEVGTVLAEYGVSCVTCAVGTCVLKDILDIHRLSSEDEQRMMSRIAGIVFPGRKVDIPLRKREPASPTKGQSYSPPLQELVNEHKLIKRLLATLPAMLRSLDLATGEGQQVAVSCTDFIRSYADQYHHAKEENVLFKYFDENLDILKVMHADHEAGRAHARAVLAAIERRDTPDAAIHLERYRELLTEHIRKEDEVLYPWLDKQLSDSQIGRLFSAFSEIDSQFAHTRRRCESIVETMEQRFGPLAPGRAQDIP